MITKTKADLCSGKIQDAKFHLEKLVRLEKKSRLTVASEEITNKSSYDFPNLVEALTWGKQVGSAINQPQGFEFDLQAGTHFWTEEDILMQGTSHAIAYFRGIDMVLNGLDKANTHIIFKNTLHRVVFEDCSIDIKNVSLETSGYFSKEHVIIEADSSKITYNAVDFVDVSVKGKNGSVILVQQNIQFAVHFTNHKVALEAEMKSFIKCDQTDFGGIDFVISAIDKSEIYLHHAINNTNLNLNFPLNKRSLDLSIIYDQHATGLNRVDLTYLADPASGTIKNTSGNDAILPIATQTLAGLLSATDKTKLDDLSVGFDGNLYQLLFKNVIDADRILTTPAKGEPLWVTDTKKLYIGDGATPGGLDLISIHAQHYIPVIEKGAINGVATLGPSGKIPANQMPLLAISNTFVVTSETDMLHLTAQTGDLAIRTDIGETFILDGISTDINSWYRMTFSAGVAALDDLNDVIISVPNVNQVMMYDGVHWVNKDFTSKNGAKWSATHQYYVGDMVTHAGIVYVAIIDNINDAPPSANWKTQIHKITVGKLFDSAVGYDLGDMVSYQGSGFIANKHVAASLPWQGSDWDPIHTPESGAGKVWESNRQYVIGDLVYFSDHRVNLLFSCNTAHLSSSTDTPMSGSKWNTISLDPGTI